MNLHRFARRLFLPLAAGLVCVALGGALNAQDTSATTVMHGPASHQHQIERGEVVYVSGNDLVVRLDDGELRHVVVPDSARATVDGKELSVHELQPGMKLQRTITTVTVPQEVTTVRTIEGRVWHVSAPHSVILQLPDNSTKQYTVPQGQEFMINGEKKTVFDLRKGMNVSATVITQEPVTAVEQHTKVTGSMPAPPATPPMVGVLLIETAPPAAPAPEVASAEPAPAQLPKTGSLLPLVGLLGLLCLGSGLGVRMLSRA
jgi:hypothetical protein